MSGLTESEKDEQIIDFLKQYGFINRILTVDDTASEFNKNLIVEYNSGAPLETLRPLLPYNHPSHDDPDIICCVRALADVYTYSVGGSVTYNYLSELKGIAKVLHCCSL